MESIPCKNNLFNFLDNFKKGNISFQKNNLIKVIKEYLISDDVPTPNEKIEIEKNIKKSKILLFNTLILADTQTEKTYLIIGFEKTILIVEKTSTFLENLLSNNSEPSVCFFENSKDILIKSIKIQNPEIKYDNLFEMDISYLNQKCKLCDSNKNFSKIWKSILPCITGYFMQNSYLKLIKNRFKDFDPSDYKKDTNYAIIDEDDYIELYSIGSGTFIAMLIYHIKLQQLLVFKKPCGFTEKSIASIYMEREKYAYSQICYPLIPKFYGITKKEGYCVIEYIKGATLDKIVNELSFDEKITIIFEIMMTVCYLHQHYLIYRDLKPNNVIIDENKNAVLIDFDCLKKLRQVSKEQNEDHTDNFDSNFIAPEIFQGILTYKSDVYSIGKMIDFIMNGESSKDNQDDIRKIYQSAINENEDLRPSVPSLIKQFYDSYKIHIKIDNLPEFFNEIYPGFVIDQTLCYAQCFLGIMYFQGEHVARNIDRAIHFFTLSANQNQELLNLQYGPSRKAQMYSQVYLANIYEKDDKHKNIDKAVLFYKLAADNEDCEAQCYLGTLYEKRRYVNPDINKAIHYYSLAAYKNNSEAQYRLGFIYNNSQYVRRDISKAIHYYSLAANQNHPNAQFWLGLIYEEGRFVNQDINKAIRYYTLAANHNQLNAQVRLSQMYHHGINVKPNAEKAIKYYQLLS